MERGHGTIAPIPLFYFNYFYEAVPVLQEVCERGLPNGVVSSVYVLVVGGVLRPEYITFCLPQEMQSKIKISTVDVDAPAKIAMIPGAFAGAGLGLIHATLCRIAPMDFDNIIYFRYLLPPLMRMQRAGKVWWRNPAVEVVSNKVLTYDAKLSEPGLICSVCMEAIGTLGEALVMDCCGGMVICATCAAKDMRCLICRKATCYYSAAPVDDKKIPADEILRDMRDANMWENNFKLIADVGTRVRIKKLPAADYRVLVTGSHPADVDHFKYDIIISNSPVLNEFNLGYERMATNCRKGGLVVIMTN